jgi:hypothetical protein
LPSGATACDAFQLDDLFSKRNGEVVAVALHVTDLKAKANLRIEYSPMYLA